MNLYLISQTINDEYDTYDSAVVVAPSEDDARNMTPGGGSGYGDAWTTPEHVTVQFIGVAADGIAGVVCSSFNAG